MKSLLFLLAGALFMSCDSQNLPDHIDANVTPAAQEEREEEAINSPDYVDENVVPATQEDRFRNEESVYEDEGLYRQ